MQGIVKAEFVAWAKDYEGPRFHAVLCDPPYGLEFMGKEWDRRPSFQAWTTEWTQALLPLLHPGALVFAFGGTRTWHRLACGFEDAGFEIWDTLMWLHGQGFPKAQAIDKLIDKQAGALSAQAHGFNAAGGKEKYGNQDKSFRSDYGFRYDPRTDSASLWSGHKTAALKPAWEPILCFRAPRQGKSYAELALEHGSGALNVDGGRITGVVPKTIQGASSKIYGGGKGLAPEGYQESSPSSLGRYPANLVLECTCERTESEKAIRHTDPDCPAYRLDEQAGDRPSGGNTSFPKGMFGLANNNRVHYKQTGGPSRFFYCAKASRSERGKDNRHPTVKPVALTKWLATLLLPPDSVRPRRLLVPFAGSGSEMIGAIEAGWDEVLGVERSGEYAEINSELAVQPPLLR